jgi:hypothetical protein
MRYTYYWINERNGPAYSVETDRSYGRYYLVPPLTLAKKVWCRGPKGGIQLVRCNWWHSDEGEHTQVGYITNIPAAMQEFSWIVLSATPTTFRI